MVACACVHLPSRGVHEYGNIGNIAVENVGRCGQCAADRWGPRVFGAHRGIAMELDQEAMETRRYQSLLGYWLRRGYGLCLWLLDVRIHVWPQRGRICRQPDDSRGY